ncbi:MAG: aspartyl/asparaginyl beta-hydroxylase domain-containing protein [Rhizomicrobium sp.]
MALPDRVRLPFAFDAALLQRDIAVLEAEKWVRHVARMNYDGVWDMLPLRAPAGETHPIRLVYPDPTARRFVDTALLAACPAFRAVLARFACPLRTVRLMRLTPGSAIKEHADLDLNAEDGFARIHVPVTSNPGVTFELNRRRVDMAPGSAWYLRLSDPHRAANNGATDRVHLVIDAVPDDWLRGLLARAAQAAAAGL